jgi:hypothetical protein
LSGKERERESRKNGKRDKWDSIRGDKHGSGRRGRGLVRDGCDQGDRASTLIAWLAGVWTPPSSASSRSGAGRERHARQRQACNSSRLVAHASLLPSPLSVSDPRLHTGHACLCACENFFWVPEILYAGIRSSRIIDNRLLSLKASLKTIIF